MSFQEPGICPLCGSYDVEYGCGELYGEGYKFFCQCAECDFEGYEHYNLVFVGHTDANSDTPSALIA